jgi:hypothetical protein
VRPALPLVKKQTSERVITRLQQIETWALKMNEETNSKESLSPKAG